MITVRKAMRLDTNSMADLLNEIIKIGGTTAIVRPVTGDDIAEWMTFSPELSAWHVALDDNEKVVGFQWFVPSEQLPPEAAEIATFVQVGQTGLGIGSALFTATAKAAEEIGYVWIRANIRADNEGGLTYYQSRGFRDYGIIENYELADGTLVTKRLKRYDI
ncbi:GNAT family N-acetyltransferase [Sulfitobacter donghicola]|uniref:Acetyltransferase n=1 Tax=Sulfitobacter donghicola DSW-25 = KCTC 12864 = JCM 14565 TaxID=1300350 RepID=A0A073IZ08_9RHOB|nr:GNAT family N-acetyltransferase [Sulfitobacter donghicola]KEJ90622.1 acetyltransferase [Sulfitobacter donghicola DSW-25 = KCTC 12864 = JCM 14565]KIN67871.1 Acetyltransferase, GNAT family [Sulfitobacter donghicola DSW-25 = KCTC 12864 = JCM 14565]